MQPQTTPRVFLSHAHFDRDSAVRIVRVLTGKGAEVFLDQDILRAGDALEENLRKGIDWCDALLLIWSRHASSHWVLWEVQSAVSAGKRIVPYILDETPLPAQISQHVWIDKSDQRVGDAALLLTIFPFYVPADDEILPGWWKLMVDLGFTRQAYHVQLRPTGQMAGQFTFDVAGLMRGVGIDFPSIPVSLEGAWTFNRDTRMASFDISGSNNVSEGSSEKIHLADLQPRNGVLEAKDLSGRHWSLSPQFPAVYRINARKLEAYNLALQKQLNPESPFVQQIVAAVFHGFCVSDVAKYGLVGLTYDFGDISIRVSEWTDTGGEQYRRLQTHLRTPLGDQPADRSVDIKMSDIFKA